MNDPPFHISDSLRSLIMLNLILLPPPLSAERYRVVFITFSSRNNCLPKSVI